MKISRALMTTALVFGMSAAPILAQDRTPGPPPDRPSPTTTTQDRQHDSADKTAQQIETASGQLVSVDAKAKTFSIKTAAGVSMMFTYTDATKVTGADETVSGLAAKSGTDVTVQYSKNGSDNVASQIEVQKPKV